MQARAGVCEQNKLELELEEKTKPFDITLQ